MLGFFDPLYLLILAPAILLGLWAQFRVKSTYALAMRMPAPLSGAAAARHILDSAGSHDVEIEMVPGHLSDHYPGLFTIPHWVAAVVAEGGDGRGVGAI